MPYWSSGDIAETFGLVEFASVAVLTTVVSQCVIRVVEHVDVTCVLTNHEQDSVSPEASI